MGFLDTLTTDTAKQQAINIKANIAGTNRDNLNAFFTAVSNNLDLLAYNPLSLLTISRNDYELNKVVRRRNSIYKAIRAINDRYSASAEFFLNFTSTDPELIDKINQIQSVIFSLNFIYLQDKYFSKEVVSIQQGVGVVNGNTTALKTLINDFNAYFTG